MQEEIANGNTEIDRELRREFNLTARAELLDSEEIIAGEWHEGRAGEISVDEELASRARIVIGTTMTFLIQGFEVTSTVTSLRKTESRSGPTFFYFVLAPEDLEMFPGVYFGFADYTPEKQKRIRRFSSAKHA